ncbi:MAG: putative DNA binding domain-containing protein [Fibrobacteraceae bacterium]|nr:putative DNA binding domain-containing protein [Fibrobacteraceae bacterium]
MRPKEATEFVQQVLAIKSESNFIEVKAAAKGCPKIFDTLSSFSNQQNGGFIIFGIDEENGFSPCGVYNAQDLQKKIAEQCLQMEPPVAPLCNVVKIDGKTFVCAEVPEIMDFQKPCFYKGAGRLRGSYVRVADSDKLMSEYEVYSFEAFRQKIEDELRTVGRASSKEIFTKAYKKFLQMLKVNKPKAARFEPSTIAQLQGFAIAGTPTIAGLLLFAEYPQAYLPQLGIVAVAIPGNVMGETDTKGNRFTANKRIEGNLTEMLEDSMTFVKQNIRQFVNINNSGKRTDAWEYPLIAIREAVLNALVHRDYSIHTENSPILIRIFTDRIEIENPGGLYGRMTIDKLGQAGADTRNPYLANALEVLQQTENRYSGIPTIRRALEDQGLKPAKFESVRGVFRVTFYNSPDESSTLTDCEKRILEFCKHPRSRSEIAELFGKEKTIAYIMETAVHPLIEKGLLKQTIPEKPKSKNQKYVTKE